MKTNSIAPFLTLSVPSKTKVTKRTGHDRISVEAKFPSGGMFRFSLSRSGETLTFGGSSDPKVANAQQAALKAMVKLRDGENNGQLIERLAECLRTAGSIRQLCAAYEGSLLPIATFKPVTDLH